MAKSQVYQQVSDLALACWAGKEGSAEARAALEAMDRSVLLPTLMELAQDHLVLEDKWLGAAIFAISEISPAESAMPLLLAVLRNHAIVAMESAVVALGRIGPPAAEAVPHIQRFLKYMLAAQTHRTRAIAACHSALSSIRNPSISPGSAQVEAANP